MVAIEGMLQRAQAGGSTLGLPAPRPWSSSASGSNLEESRIVRRLEADQLKRLFGSMDFGRLGEDVIFVERGQSHETLICIVEGTVEAALPRLDGGWSILRTFTSGDVIGDRALLERKPWPAFYRADTTITYLKLERPGLEKALMGNPDPRGLLDALRELHHDADVATLVAKVDT